MSDPIEDGAAIDVAVVENAAADANVTNVADSAAVAVSDAALVTDPSEPTAPSAGSKRKRDDTSADSTVGSLPLLCVAKDKWQWKQAGAIKKMLETHSLAFTRVLKARAATDAYVEFANTDDLAAAKSAIPEIADANGKKPMKIRANGVYRWHDSVASTGGSDDVDDRQRDGATNEAFGRKKNAKRALGAIADVVTPLHALPYDEQCKRKLRQAAECLKKAYKGMKDVDPAFAPPHRTDGKWLLCDMDDLIEAPTLTGYRNKAEFTMGLSSEGKKTAGFLRGSFTEGLVEVEPVDDVTNISDTAKTIAIQFSEFLQSSQYDVYDKRTHSGLWRLLTVRNTTNNESAECMVIVQINPTSLESQVVADLHATLAKFFTESLTGVTVNSLYAQHFVGKSNAADESATLTLLHGQPVIYERVLGLTFRVSPTSFLQVNTKGSERLYSKVVDWAVEGMSDEDRALVFDVCCGTGTIGLILSTNAHIASIVGIEINSQAVDDARANAELNSITNTEFVCAKAEDSMESALAKHGKSLAKVVAVVDPPRSGLHGDVIKALRKFDALRRVVYVSCNPKTLATDLVKFCQPQTKRVRGRPFRAKRSVAVDMFPSTEHCEMIVQLERE